MRKAKQETISIERVYRRVKDGSLAAIVRATYPANSPDARKAVALLERIKRRSPQKTIQSVVNEAVIEDLASAGDWSQPKFNGASLIPEYIKGRAIANDRDFFERLGRAIYEGRGGAKRAARLFLLENWDRLKYPSNYPEGLKFFTDEAAHELLKLLFPDCAPPSLSAYREFKRPLKLPKVKPARVRSIDQQGTQILLKPK